MRLAIYLLLFYKSQINVLNRVCYEDVPDKSSRTILSIISRLKEAGPLSAEGYYDVNKSLLVAFTGTLLTYVIILIQMT